MTGRKTSSRGQGKTKPPLREGLREVARELSILKRKLRESERFVEYNGFSLPEDPDPDAHLWRPITKTTRDLTVTQQERQIDIAHFLYLSNPLAFRIIEITKDFVVGDGITFRAKDPRVQKVLREHWDDPDNNWDIKQHTKALELGLFGEQLYPVFVNNVNGHVKLGVIDPKNVDRIETDPENAECAVCARVKSGMYGRGRRTYDLVRIDEDPKSPTFGYRTGEAFYFAVNRVALASRGHSDLLPLADWLDSLDAFMMTRLEKAILLNSFFWDCTLTGADDQQVRKFAEGNKRIKPGMTRFHNDKVSWQAVMPDLKASDAAEEIRVFRNHVLGGAGLPEHWFSEGGSSNRATAAEQGVPTTKRLVARQRFFKHMIRQIFEFVIDQAMLRNVLPLEADRGFQIHMPAIFVKDTQAVSAALSNAANGLMLAEQQEWISPADARKVFAFMVSQLGVETEEAPGLKKREEPDSPAEGSERDINWYDRKLHRIREQIEDRPGALA
jgi:hypothetical protein